jgi:hypothetical protein
MSVDEAFAGYVNGRTIAVVGTAPLDGDQTAEIEAHDLVYVVSGLCHSHDVRADIVFINGEQTRTFERQGRDCLAYQADWVVAKRRTRRTEPRYRSALLGRSRLNANQVTGALLDLAYFDPAAVTVYGADFYLGGPSAAYSLTYLRNAEQRGGRRSLEAIDAGIRAHKQDAQRQAIRDLIDRKGWPTGDARYLHAVNVTDDEYRRAYTALWRAPDAARAWSDL